MALKWNKQCPDCGENLTSPGAWRKHRMEHDGLKIKVDKFTEQPLSEFLARLRELLKKYQHTASIAVSEQNGKAKEVEITVRFQV